MVLSAMFTWNIVNTENIWHWETSGEAEGGLGGYNVCPESS